MAPHPVQHVLIAWRELFRLKALLFALFVGQEHIKTRLLKVLAFPVPLANPTPTPAPFQLALASTAELVLMPRLPPATA